MAKYKIGNNPFELPTNTDLEKVLKKNLDTINPVEMKEISSNGKKMLFPFWTPVKDAGGNTFTDPKEYLAKKAKSIGIKEKKDKVGIVQAMDAMDAAKAFDDVSLQDKVTSIINNHNKGVPFDNTGAVKSISASMDKTKTAKQITDNKVDQPKEATVEKAAKSKTGVGAVDPKADMGKQNIPDVTGGSKKASGSQVGAVKPKAENMPSKSSKQIIKNDVSKPSKPKVEKASKSKTGVGAVTPKADMGKQNIPNIDGGAKKASGGNVGAVKPKAEKMPSKNAGQITKNDVSKPTEPKVEKASKAKTGVGAVTPKDAMGKQNGVGEINFDKYKTDHITKPGK